jgi:hypothetical protein
LHRREHPYRKDAVPSDHGLFVQIRRSEGWGNQAYSRIVNRVLSLERTTGTMDFFSSWTFILLMVVLLVGLVGVLFYLRNQRPED